MFQTSKIKIGTTLGLVRKLILTSTLFCLCACVTPIVRTVLKVNSKEDIPDISQQYSYQINHLKIGMTKGQVIALFPEMEQECFESGVCNFTVFNETLIQIEHKIGDLNLLTTSLVTMLGLTCIFSKNDCNEAIFAALNVGIASTIKHHQIHSTAGDSKVLTLVQWINIEFVDDKVSQWAINEPLPQFQPKSFDNKLPSLEDALKL